VNTGGIHGYGAGMYNDTASPMLVRCILLKNTSVLDGAGIYNATSEPVLSHCVFDGNSGRNGGGMFNYQSSPPLINCVFRSNSAVLGGALHNYLNSSPYVFSCTFYMDQALQEGKVIYNNDHCLPRFYNSILWGNADVGVGPQIYDTDGSAAQFDFCIIRNGWSGAGTGNLSTDPAFRDTNYPEGKDRVWATHDDGLVLSSSSPGLDSGANSRVPEDKADIDGDYDTSEYLPMDMRGLIRTVNGTVDRGAYEHQRPVVTFVLGSHGTRIGGGALEQQVGDGQGATAPTVQAEFGWALTGWNPVFNDVYVDTTVTALYGPFFSAGGICHVKVGGTGDGSTWANAAGNLQKSIEAIAMVGGQVWVAAGTYRPDSWPNGGTDPRLKHFSLRNNVAVLGSFPATGDPGLDDRSPGTPTICSGDIGVTGNSGDNCYHVFWHPGGTAAINDTARLDGVVITGGYANVETDYVFGAGMFNSQSSPVISRCVFSGNMAGWQGGALYMGNSSNSRVVNCVFTQNLAYEGGGVFVYESAPVFTNCVFAANVATGWGGGVRCYSNGQASFFNCTLSGNTGGALSSLGSTASLSNCIIWGNFNYQIDSPTATLNHCIIEGGWTGSGSNNINADPLFLNAADPDGADNVFGTNDDGLQPAAGSPAIDSGSISWLPADTTDLDGDGNVVETLPLDLPHNPRIRGPQVDCGAYEPLVMLVYHVRTTGTGNGFTWATSLADPQVAIELAAVSGNSQVWIAAGTYYPQGFPNGGSTAREMHFALRNGVPVFGSFPATGDPGLEQRGPTTLTVLSGEIGSPATNTDNCYHVFYHTVGAAALDSSARLDGAVITGGNANGSLSHNYGGGMFNDGGCSPTLVHCVFRNNRSERDGGGLFMSGSTSQVFDCVFTDNTASASGGGAFTYGSTSGFTNCLFYSNDAGSGLYEYMGSASTVSHCTFYQNTGYGVKPLAGTKIYNSILWANTLGQLIGSCTVANSDVQGGWAGVGNFSTDPLFANAADPDGADDAWFTTDDGLRLTFTSPALNAGNPSLLPPDTADLDNDGITTEPLPEDMIGTNRCINGLPEPGPYEFDTTGMGMSLAFWRTLHFSATDRTNPAREATVWGNNADPDGDSVPNSGEYVLMLNPWGCDSPFLPLSFVNLWGTRWMRFVYTEATDRPGVVISSQFSTALAQGSWTSTDILPQSYVDTPPARTWTILIPAYTDRCFVRMGFQVP
jgi:hypothetical protein